MQNNCQNNKNSKFHIFSRSTLEAAVIRTPKVEILLKQAKMDYSYDFLQIFLILSNSYKKKTPSRAISAQM